MNAEAADPFLLRELLVCGRCLGHPMYPAVIGERRVYRCSARWCWRWVVADVVERLTWAQFVAALPAMAEVEPERRAQALGDHLLVVRLAPGLAQTRLMWSRRPSGGA